MKNYKIIIELFPLNEFFSEMFALEENFSKKIDKILFHSLKKRPIKGDSFCSLK